MTWVEDYTNAMMKSAPTPGALLVRGEGCYVWDVDGKKYLDFLAGIAVNSLGHAHPVLVEAISAQVASLVHISNLFASPQQIGLAQSLKRITGAGEGGRVFFGNSGAEAIEAAIKLARRNKQHGTIIALENSFHGRTTGSVSLTGKPALREDFEPLLPQVLHIGSTIEALEAAMTHDIAALVVEPIKGEAGVIPLPEGYLQRARELCTQHGALLIIDEIQTGAGRTGTWFAYQQAGIVPDAVAIAKGIGGGVPIGALVTFGAASDLFTKGQHGSTFGGNPLATGAAVAVIAEIERAGLIENAAVRGPQIRAAVEGLPLVESTRGLGLLIGIVLEKPVASDVAATALQLGLIVNAANDSTLRIAPPLIIGDAEITEFVSLLTRALEAHA
jgi:acetylornithine/N-succinyldiaminopimelate aminotransferase